MFTMLVRLLVNIKDKSIQIQINSEKNARGWLRSKIIRNYSLLDKCLSLLSPYIQQCYR